MARPKEIDAVLSVKIYQKTNNIDDLEPAMSFLNPLIAKRVGQFKSVEIPQYVLQRKAKEYVIDGLKNYNPEKASIGTHAFNQLRQLRRYVIRRQNTARLPEHTALKIGTFKAAQQHLKEQLERDPSTGELADYLSWPAKRVEAMVTSDRSSSISQDTVSSMTPFYHPMEDQADILYYSLSPEEQNVFDMLTGMHGQKKYSVTDAAKKLKVPYSQVYKVKRDIMRKMTGAR